MTDLPIDAGALYLLAGPSVPPPEAREATIEAAEGLPTLGNQGVNHDRGWRCRGRGAILAASTLIGNHLSVKKWITEIVGRRLSDPDAADALV